MLNNIQQYNIVTNNNIYQNRNNSVNFRGLKNTSTQQDKFESTNKNNKIGYATLATVAIASIAEIILAKGKHVKNIFKKTNTPKIKTTQKKNEENTYIQKQVKEYFETKERELNQHKQRIAESNERNEQWLQEQHIKKEQEYSDFWNKQLEAKEKVQTNYDGIKFDKEIEDAPLANNIDLDWHFNKFKQSDDTKQALKDCENLTFDTPNLKLIKDNYDDKNIYDLGLRYAIVANNTVREKGSAIIKNEIPEIFKGLDENELFKTLDELPVYLEPRKLNKFKIGEKEFTAESIGSGCLNDAYLIKDANNNQICYKAAKNPYQMNTGQGVYDEIAIWQEAQNAGVKDIPKLYIANPVGYFVQAKDELGTTTKGAWEVVEFVKDSKQVPENALKLTSWLKEKGLHHGDLHAGNYIGDTIIDLGGICDDANQITSLLDESHSLQWLFKAYHNGMSTTDILKKLDKIEK